MAKKFSGPDRRKFERLNYTKPLAYKVCKKKTLSSLLHGYTHNISQAGLSCNIKEAIKKGDALWLGFDKNMLSFFQGLDNKALVYQNGIIGKVVWTKRKDDGSLDIGVAFITRLEKNLSHIYPKFHFLEKEIKKTR